MIPQKPADLRYIQPHIVTWTWLWEFPALWLKAWWHVLDLSDVNTVFLFILGLLTFSSSSFSSSTELQAAICVHRYPAPLAQHGQRLLEAGAGLPLHLHSDAQWRRPSTGKRGQSIMPTFTIPSNTDLPDLEVYKNICLSSWTLLNDNGFDQLPKVQGPYPPIERRTDQCMVR